MTKPEKRLALEAARAALLHGNGVLSLREKRPEPRSWLTREGGRNVLDRGFTRAQ